MRNLDLKEINEIRDGSGFQLYPPLNEFFEKYLDQIKLNEKNGITSYLYVRHEIVTEPNVYYGLLNLISKNNLKNIKLSISTLGNYEYCTKPETNIYMWAGTTIRQEIDNIEEQNTFMFTNFPNLDNKKITKAIISSRKETEPRDKIFEYKFKSNDIISRYAKFQLDNKDYSQFPIWDDLVEEYKGSLISFVLETYNWSGDFHFQPPPQFSEKTIMAFLSGTMPVVYGDVGLVKSLEDMGFHLWNDYFGFNEDFLQQTDKIKQKEFKKAMERVDNMTFEEVEELYKTNFHLIQKNYDIVKACFLEKSYI